MKIVRHRLQRDDGTPFEFVSSPNRGGRLDPRYLVMHYTAGRDLRSSVNWFANPVARASAHLVIGRDGEIVQCVAFDRVAWHAGRSRWAGLDGLNAYSIGIELDNAGRLTRMGESWVAWFGAEIPDDEVVVATHRLDSEPAGWHAFTEAQLESAVEVGAVLVERYGLIEVVAHDDISPDRKRDTGPAFPMLSYRSRIEGRKEDREDRFVTTTVLNIRSGPGTENPTLEGGPLPTGTEVLVLGAEGSWRRVEVLAEVGGVMDLEGWVHGRFLARLAAAEDSDGE